MISLAIIRPTPACKSTMPARLLNTSQQPASSTTPASAPSMSCHKIRSEESPSIAESLEYQSQPTSTAMAIEVKVSVWRSKRRSGGNRSRP